MRDKDVESFFNLQLYYNINHLQKSRLQKSVKIVEFWHMKVILLQNIKGFGQIGDVKNVSDGYARNFLLPRNLAKSANEGSLKEVESLKAKRVIMVETEKKNALEAVEKLKDLVIELTRKASKAGKLFAGIDKEDLV